jgi:ParB family transcriptional regulator, chromosome partitioning protein
MSIAKGRSRLGRGLSSLIGTTSEAAETSGLPVMRELPPIIAGTAEPAAAPDTGPAKAGSELPVNQITVNPHQPRRSFDETGLAQLAESLKSSGLIQPIIVRQVEGGYQLIAGERRLRAAKMAGLKTIPAIVRDVDGLTQAQMALVENIQREDLNPLDRAAAYRTLMDQLGLTQAELAGRLGEDRSSIANYLRLLDLPEPVREDVRAGRLSLGHAKLLAGVDDVLEQQRLAELTIAQELSVRNLERVIQSPHVQASKASPTAPSAYIADLEKTISRQLGMRVQVRRSGSKGKGRLVIHYGSLDQFDQLVAKLGVAVE